MVYLMRFILWMVIIIFISWMMHKLGKKFIKHEKLQNYFGWIVFFIIILTPVTIAKIAQMYYCWKYQPFYKIVEPLGEDFEGYYGGDIREVMKKYPTIKYVDGKVGLDGTGFDRRLSDKYKDLKKNSKKRILYSRDYITDSSSDECIYPSPKERELYKEGKYKLDDIFAKENKCIARKVISESEVSRYVLRGKFRELEDKILFQIPGIVEAYYYRGSVFSNRITGKSLAWGASVNISWDLYGVLGQEGARPYFYCGKDFDLVKTMIEEKGVKNGK